MLQPTTPHALPLARTARGKISAGYSHGTVSQVAPKTAVKMKTMAAAPAPKVEARAVLPAAAALSTSRVKTPRRIIAIPCATDPLFVNVSGWPMIKHEGSIPVESPSSSNAIQCKDTHERRNSVSNRVQTTQPADLGAGVPSQTENSRLK